jgi:uncharacterized protein
MRKLVTSALLFFSGVASAQVPPAEIGQRYIPAPWWMRDPVIAAKGSVQVDLPANRASFTANFNAVERDSAAAVDAASRKVAAIDGQLRALGADRLRLTTTFATRPLYEQYRDKDGHMVDNTRADQIERYEATAELQIEVRDLAALESAYNAVVAARPTSLGTVGFSLEPDNSVKSALANEAVRDATRRAREAVQSAGGHLGAIKIIDPSGSVCETQVLAGWPSYTSGTRATDVDAIQITNAPAVAQPAPPPSPTSGEIISTKVTLQPPRQRLADQACVIFGLLP